MSVFKPKTVEGLLRWARAEGCDVFDLLEAVPEYLPEIHLEEDERRRREFLDSYPIDWARIRRELAGESGEGDLSAMEGLGRPDVSPTGQNVVAGWEMGNSGIVECDAGEQSGGGVEKESEILTNAQRGNERHK